MITRFITTQARQYLAITLLSTLVFATGCKNFFTDPNDTGTGTGTTNTGDYVYVASVNTASATAPIYTVSGFSVGTASLTAISGSPVTLPFAPQTLAVNPANSLLYVSGSQVLSGFTIASTGALTAIESATDSTALVNADIVSMVISPDGQWLLALDANNSIVTIDEFQITSAGQLTVLTPTTYALTNSTAVLQPTSIAVDPTGQYVMASLGTGGDVLFGFNTTTGALTAETQINVPTVSTADQAATFDSTAATVYIARSGTDGGIVPYTIASGGVLTVAAGAPFASGAGPASILIDATGKYLYAANKSDSTISGYSIGASGVLTALAGSPFASGTSPTALGRDNSGKYILSTAVNGSPDLKMYSFDATALGQLDASTTIATGDPTEPAGAVALALTH